MLNIISIIAGFVFIGILVLTSFTNIGVRGIKKYYSDFKLFDMQLHYNYKDIHESLTHLSSPGREAYQRYLYIDYIFIISFLILMILGGNLLTKNTTLKFLLILFAVSRALFDVIENTILLYLINLYPNTKGSLPLFCSYATTLKFVCLFCWIAIVFICYIKRFI